MKSYLSAVALVATLALAGCGPKPQAAATGDQAQTAVADQAAPTPKKKRCSDQTGSRLAPCGEGSTGDYVQGQSGDAFRQDMAGKSIGGTHPQ